jgi:hypothetical protein
MNSRNKTGLAAQLAPHHSTKAFLNVSALQLKVLHKHPWHLTAPIGVPVTGRGRLSWRPHHCSDFRISSYLSGIWELAPFHKPWPF